MEIYFGTIEWIDLENQLNGHWVHTARMNVVDTLGDVSSHPGSTITIFGQDGLSCGEDFMRLEVGAFYVIALIKYGGQHQMQDTFHLLGCDKLFEKMDLTNPDGPTIEEVKMKVRASITSTRESNHEQIKVYPNPVKDYLFVNTPFDGIQTFKVLDLTGKIILEITSTLIPGSQSVDVRPLSNGMYILHISNGKDSLVRRFVKSG